MNTPSPDIRTLHSLLFSRLARYLLAALLGASAVAAHGQVSGTSSVIATDNAGNYSSFGGSAESSSPANGGSGFGAWNFTGNSTTNTSYCGEFLGAAPNTGLIGSGNSWGLYSNTSNTASIYRGFGFDIIGDTISVDLENTSTINGTIGWSLWNASQTNMTEFFFASGNTNWTVPDAAGSASSVSYTTSAIQTDITITSATTFSLTATINGGSSSMTTGSFENGTTATGISDLFRFFSFNDGNSNNLYINNEQVFVSTYSGASGNYGTAGNWSSNGQLSATPINGANIAFGGSVAATATNNLVTTVNSYTFNGAAGSYTLSGSAVTLGDAGSDNSGITNNSSNLQTVAENLTLGSGATGATVGATVTSASGATTLAGTVNLNGSRLLVTGTGNTTISGLVSGASDILKQGTGTLLLNNAANTFGVNTSGTGNVYIDAGTVSVGATGALGSTDGATYGAVNVGSSVSTQSTNNTALLISTGGVTVSNPIDARYFTGNTYGTEQIGGSNTSGVATFSGPIFLHNSLTISSVSGGTVNISGAISQGGTTGAFAGEAVNGTPGITTTGNGVVELTGTSTYSGATTVGGGAMILSGSLTGTSSASVASGASLEVDGGLNNSATTTVPAPRPESPASDPRASKAPWSCVTTTSAVFSSRTIPNSKSMIDSPVFESRFPVGSSAKITPGLFISARAIATRCCSPPDSSAGRCCNRSPSPTRSSAACAAAGSGRFPIIAGSIVFSSAVNSGSRK
jgi:fibronectin-binding autotransporter adhesin